VSSAGGAKNLAGVESREKRAAGATKKPEAKVREATAEIKGKICYMDQTS